MRSKHVNRETPTPAAGPLLRLAVAAVPALMAGWLLDAALAQQPAPQIPGLVVSNTPPAGRACTRGAAADRHSRSRDLPADASTSAAAGYDGAAPGRARSRSAGSAG